MVGCYLAYRYTGQQLSWSWNIGIRNSQNTIWRTQWKICSISQSFSSSEALLGTHCSCHYSTEISCGVRAELWLHACLYAQFCLTLWGLWTVACQAPLCMGFSRQEYWCGLPFAPPGDLSDPGIKPRSPALASRFFTTAPPGKPQELCQGSKEEVIQPKSAGAFRRAERYSS